MTGVEAEQLLARDCVAQVKLVRPDYVTLRANPEEFSFDRVEIVRRIDRIGEDRVERLQQSLARSFSIDWHVLVTIGNPDVRHAGRSQRLAHRRADAPADDSVTNPE